MFEKAKPYLAVIAVIAGFGNFFWTNAEAQSLGGDAVNGYERGGHYFLASHGTYTEVTQAVWTWSRIHTISMIVLFLIGFVAMAWLVTLSARSAAAGQATPEVAGDRARWVRESGAPMWTARESGKIGEVSFSRSLLEVTVYPGGIILKPSPLPEQTIIATEITDVIAKRGLQGRYVKVEHAGAGGASPLVLWMSETDPLAAAIRECAAHPPATVPDFPVETPPAARGWTRYISVRVSGPGFGLAVSPLGTPPGLPGVILNAFGLVVAVGFIAYGILSLIPNTGLFGVIWTIACVAILASNLWRIVHRGR